MIPRLFRASFYPGGGQAFALAKRGVSRYMLASNS